MYAANEIDRPDDSLDLPRSSSNRVAELEAELAATKHELREAKDRLQELRHRISNELQELMSLVAIQARAANRPDHCKRCILGLTSAAELHNVLDNGGVEAVSMAGYLSTLSGALGKALDERIDIETVVEAGVNLDHRRAQCVGLIYAEAAMNALKYAFPDRAAGKIEVRFGRSGDFFVLTVSDNGVGFDPASAQPGHGIRLMMEFARELQGELQFSRLPTGTMVRLTFACTNA